MPQFDTTWFLSEAFWMLVCFGLFYGIMAYFIFPIIQDIFTEREHKIKNDLSVAEVINKQAAHLIQEYKSKIYSAEQTKAAIINETYRDIQKYAAHVDAENEQKFRQQIEDTEKKVRRLKDMVMQQSDVVAAQIAQELANKLAVKPTKTRIK